MEKARDGSFVRTTRKTAEDDDEEDWDGTLNRYDGLPTSKGVPPCPLPLRRPANRKRNSGICDL
jgi:hypothetical protein